MKLRYTSSADLHIQWQYRNKKRADYLGDYTWQLALFFMRKIRLNLLETVFKLLHKGWTERGLNYNKDFRLFHNRPKTLSN